MRELIKKSQEQLRDSYNKAVEILKQSFDNACKRLEEFNPQDIDDDKIKQTYSLNDKTFERLKGEAKTVEKVFTENDLLTTSFINRYTEELQSSIKKIYPISE